MIRNLLHYLKRIVQIRWINTLYINFRLLPISDAIKLPIIITGKTKLRLSGIVEFKCPVRFGLVNIGFDVDNMPITFSPTQIMIKGKLIIGGDIIVNKGANLVVWPNATMKLGNDVMICSGVTLKATNRVTVGNHVMISSGCFIMDSSIHCIYNTETMEVSSPFSEITIGDNVWLNMYTDVIKSGGVANGCITARYTLINKPANCADTNCFLAGQPAKVVKRNVTQLHNLSSEKDVKYYFNSSKHEHSLILSENQISLQNMCKEIKQ